MSTFRIVDEGERRWNVISFRIIHVLIITISWIVECPYLWLETATLNVMNGTVLSSSSSCMKMASHPQLSHQPGKFPVHVNFNQLRSDISVEINTIEETINGVNGFILVQLFRCFLLSGSE